MGSTGLAWGPAGSDLSAIAQRLPGWSHGAPGEFGVFQRRASSVCSSHERHQGHFIYISPVIMGIKLFFQIMPRVQLASGGAKI